MARHRLQQLGRPTLYNIEMADRIIELVESSPFGLKKLCDMHDDLPNLDSIYAWRAKYEDFSERFLNARKKQAHILFETSRDDIEEIKDYYYDDPKTGARCVDSGIVAAQKAIAKHKIGMAARIRPKDYGVTSVDNNNNVASEVSADVVKEKEKDY